MSIYFCKTGNSTHACLKIINNNGDELSLAGDDSCGAMQNLSRLDAIVFYKTGTCSTGVPILDPETFLRQFAKHMGFSLRKKGS